MDFQNVGDGRRMVRRYTAATVAPASIDRMLRNAVCAPNAGSTQGLGIPSTSRTRDGGAVLGIHDSTA